MGAGEAEGRSGGGVSGVAANGELRMRLPFYLYDTMRLTEVPDAVSRAAGGAAAN